MGENMSKKTKTTVSKRRRFLKKAAATGALATAGLLAACKPKESGGGGGGGKTVTLKMQAAWPSGANIFFEMAKDYTRMVEEMSGGELKIDLQPVGAVVKTSEIG